MATTMHFFPSK